MTVDELRVAIVGTGGMAARRAEALSRIDGARTAVVASRDPERARLFARQHGGDPSADWRQAATRDDVDAVFVCTPNDSHTEIARTALEAGKHVLVEYALARTLHEARTVVDAAEKSGRVLHVGHTNRLDGNHRIARSGLSGLGGLLSARVSVLFGRKPRKWFPDPRRLGSVFVGAMLHFHDQLTDLFGRPEWIDAHLEMARTSEGLVDWDVAHMWMGYSSGGVAQITYGRGLVPPGWSFESRFACRSGYLTWDGGDSKWVRVKGDETRTLSVPGVDTVVEDTEAFVSAVRDGKPLYLTPQEAVFAVAVGDAADLSAREGRRVRLSDFLARSGAS